MENIQNKPDYAMNKVCSVFGSVLFTSIIVLGNSSSIIEANSLKSDYLIVCEGKSNNIYKSFSNLDGISFDLPGYTANNINSSMENIVVDYDKVKNMEKLDMIEKLTDGWDGETAKAFDASLIKRAKDVILALSHQPEVFPTACDSIQFEFDHSNGSYLEFEIFLDRQIKFFSIDKNGKEQSYIATASDKEICEVVNKFYG